MRVDCPRVGRTCSFCHHSLSVLLCGMGKSIANLINPTEVVAYAENMFGPVQRRIRHGRSSGGIGQRFSQCFVRKCATGGNWAQPLSVCRPFFITMASNSNAVLFSWLSDGDGYLPFFRSKPNCRGTDMGLPRFCARAQPVCDLEFSGTQSPRYEPGVCDRTTVRSAGECQLHARRLQKQRELRRL